VKESRRPVNVEISDPLAPLDGSVATGSSSERRRVTGTMSEPSPGRAKVT